jgi:hypothetical protein
VELGAQRSSGAAKRCGCADREAGAALKTNKNAAPENIIAAARDFWAALSCCFVD